MNKYSSSKNLLARSLQKIMRNNHRSRVVPVSVHHPWLQHDCMFAHTVMSDVWVRIRSKMCCAITRARSAAAKSALCAALRSDSRVCVVHCEYTHSISRWSEFRMCERALLFVAARCYLKRLMRLDMDTLASIVCVSITSVYYFCARWLDLLLIHILFSTSNYIYYFLFVVT